MDNNRPCEKQTPVFPADFAWGVATSAHQVEGQNLNNQWHAWECNGRIKSRDRVGLACNWWKNAEQDFDLAKSLGINALRLSVEWSRIEPSPGQWDNAALMRYREILKALRDRGMRPFVTLHHFTNPLWFEIKGHFLPPNQSTFFSVLRGVCWPRWEICAPIGQPLMSRMSIQRWGTFWENFRQGSGEVSLRRRT